VALPVMIFGSTAERAHQRALDHIAEYTKPKAPRGRKKAEAAALESQELEDII
jgi:hypothetical protein